MPKLLTWVWEHLLRWLFSLGRFRFIRSYLFSRFQPAGRHSHRTLMSFLLNSLDASRWLEKRRRPTLLPPASCYLGITLCLLCFSSFAAALFFPFGLCDSFDTSLVIAASHGTPLAHGRLTLFGEPNQFTVETSGTFLGSC